MARVRSAVRIDPDLQKDFTFIERRREVKVSALGKVWSAPLRTFEVFPAADPARTYKRLIAVEGKPLDPAEERERDEAHQRDLAAEERRQRRETPAQRARRLERGERERRERLAILEDALRVFQASVVSREVVDGEATIVVALTPRAGVDPATREGNWMKRSRAAAGSSSATARWFASTCTRSTTSRLAGASSAGCTGGAASWWSGGRSAASGCRGDSRSTRPGERCCSARSI